jgi:hypothetical protein
MNLEFHYYATAALAIRAGFDPARALVIARSAQHVDQCIIAYELDDGEKTWRTEKTQDYVFWDESVLREIYLPFHFIPGEIEKARRARMDGEANPWIVTPDSPIARELLVRALRSGDDFRVGIALHTYADTWAHQNFTGRLERINDLGIRSPLPPAGHLQALTSPDQAAEVWNDPRLFVPEVDNGQRFLEAAKMMYRFLRTSLRRNFDDEVLVLGELTEIWGRPSLDARARAFDFTLRYDIEPWNSILWLSQAGISTRDESEERPIGYDKLLWLREEIRRRSGWGEGTKRNGAAEGNNTASRDGIAQPMNTARRDGIAQPMNTASRDGIAQRINTAKRINTAGRYAGSSLAQWNEAAAAHRRDALGLIDASLGMSEQALEKKILWHGDGT